MRKPCNYHDTVHEFKILLHILLDLHDNFASKVCDLDDLAIGYFCRQISTIVKFMESPLVPNIPATQVSLIF